MSWVRAHLKRSLCRSHGVCSDFRCVSTEIRGQERAYALFFCEVLAWVRRHAGPDSAKCFKGGPKKWRKLNIQHSVLKLSSCTSKTNTQIIPD